MLIAQACAGDIPALESLLNSAYRGEESKKGWTSEADLISGTVRTDAATLQRLIETPGALFLKHVDDAGQLDGCVFLQKHDNRLYLGMLSVSPDSQAGGIGKQLMSAAEAHAFVVQCDRVFMKVISARKELIAWYERKGFRDTGDREPFPQEDRFGVPTRPLEFIIMEKMLEKN